MRSKQELETKVRAGSEALNVVWKRHTVAGRHVWDLKWRSIELLRSLILVAFAGVLFGRSTSAQDVEGYFLGPETALPDSLREYTEGFSISVTRSWADEFEKSLLVRAERLLPDASVIEAAVDRDLEAFDGIGLSNWSERFEEARRIEGERWWWLDDGWVITAFALTGEAVDHFVSRMRALSRSRPPDARRGEEARHGGSFRYEARVLTDAEGGFAVELEAQWRYVCGGLCGSGFTSTRRVTFDSRGRLVGIDGDGPPRGWVS